MAVNREGRPVRPEAERWAPRKSEYEGLQWIAGAWSLVTKANEVLKKRAQAVPGTWRDMRMCESVLGRISDALLQTVPSDRLAKLAAELKHTTVYLQTTKDTTGNAYRAGMMYVSRDAVFRFVWRAVNQECLFCELDEKGQKKCRLKKDLDAVFLYDAEREDGKDICFWQGEMIPEEEIRRRWY